MTLQEHTLEELSGKLDALLLATRAPRPLAVSPTEAAAMLGLSRSTFYTEVLPLLKVARVGKRVLVPVEQLEKYLEALLDVERPSDLERIRRAFATRSR